MGGNVKRRARELSMRDPSGSLEIGNAAQLCADVQMENITIINADLVSSTPKPVPRHMVPELKGIMGRHAFAPIGDGLAAWTTSGRCNDCVAKGLGSCDESVAKRHVYFTVVESRLWIGRAWAGKFCWETGTECEVSS